MRDIKFRAWDEGFNVMMHQFPDDYFLSLDGKLMVLDVEDNIFRESTAFNIMQYTGLKDRNGVEIYEGDLVMWGENIETVFFSDGMFQTETSCVDKKGCEVFEVVGNVYENPAKKTNKKT